MISATVTGFIGRDPISRETKNGIVTNFRIASSSFEGKEERTTWVSAAVWGKKAEYAATLKAGDRVALSGSLSMAEFVDKDGASKVSLEMKVVDIEMQSKKDKSDAGVSKPSKKQAATSDEDIPF